jgi:NuA3 HAT complex component NTO1
MVVHVADMFRLDKNVFKQAFQEMQEKMDRRYYVTTLPFTQDLCKAISAGIDNPPASLVPDSEPVEASPSKHHNYADAGARRRLGKRILKLLQPFLEAALKAEAEILDQPYDVLHKELEGMLEASVQVRRLPVASIMVSSDEDTAAGQSQDVDMADAPVEGQIIVADHSEGEADAEGEPDDIMNGAEPEEDNIEVGGYHGHGEHDGAISKPNGLLSAAHSVAGEPHKESTPHLTNGFMTKPSNSPPSLPDVGYSHQLPGATTTNPQPLTPPRSNTGSAASFIAQTLPATTTTTTTTKPTLALNGTGLDGTSASSSHPNNNNHTNHHSNSNSNNFLTQGGIPWYLDGFELRGTSAAQAQWTPGRDALRGLSEELTDMDEEALRDLEFDVDEEMTITIAGEGEGDEAGDEAGEGAPSSLSDGLELNQDHHQNGGGGLELVNGAGGERAAVGDGGGGGGVAAAAAAANMSGASVSAKKAVGMAAVAAATAAAASGSPRKRTRSEVAAAAVAGGRLLRKGVRSSARKK